MSAATRGLVLSSAGGSIDWATVSAQVPFGARAGLRGLGLPPRVTQWFEGAGDGATYRGTRVTTREMDFPIRVRGADEGELLERLSLLAQVLDPRYAPARFSWTVAGQTWWLPVVLVGGGDWTAGDHQDTDMKTVVRTVLTLRAGDPFWTRETASQFTVQVPTGGEPFLPHLASLHVISGQAMGSREVENPGDADAYPVWTVRGPGGPFEAISSGGEVLRWEGTLAAGEVLTINTQAGTVVDQAGANRYGDLASAPRFWSIAPGTSMVSVVLTNATTASRVTCSWRPRRWAVV